MDRPETTPSPADLPPPWDAPCDPIERITAAAVRLGISERTLRHRARTRGFSTGASAGRPRYGVVVGLLRSEWDQCREPLGRRPKPPQKHPRVAWTPREDAILARMTAMPARGRLVIDWPAVLKALPRRGKAGCESRRAELGLTRDPPPWPDKQRAILVRKFGRVSRATLMAMLPGRSWEAVLKEARRAKVTGLPPGKLMFAAAAAKFGYARATFRALCERHGVKLVAYTCCASRPGTKPQSYVGEKACQRAVKADHALETVAHGADRTGVAVATLRAWMVAEGHPVAGRAIRWTKFAPAVVDAVVALNKHRPPTVSTP